MKNLQFVLFFFVMPFCAGCKDRKKEPGSTPANGVRIIKQDLNYPWEIIWGKDDHIWMTERGGTIRRIDPATGNTTFTYTISEVKPYNEGGLLGMALHPRFDQNGFLYVVYNYGSHSKYAEKLVRYTYSNNTLNNPVVLLDGIEGSSNHNGSRLWITSEASPKIFITTGDVVNPDLSQHTGSLNGKVLRLNLDGSIPSDNPIAGNAVWSLGHRNAQGLVMVNGILYASEHGPDIEDEVNIIEKGRNYGWPEVKGPCDASETAYCRAKNVKEPIWSSGGRTLGVCGIDYYNDARISQWKNSILMMTLRNSSIRQLKLSADGRSVIETKTWFKNDWGRLRDLCISPNGKVYVCSSNGGNDDVLVEISAVKE